MIKLRIVIGLPTFERIFHASQYTDLKGGLLEAMGILFQENVKLYLYPYTDMNSGSVVYPDDYYFKDEYSYLWKYLTSTRKILLLNGIPYNHLKITGTYISELIELADKSLQDYVPVKVYEHIKSHKLFGYGDKVK